MQFQNIPPEIAERSAYFRNHPNFRKATQLQVKRYLGYYETNPWINQLTNSEGAQYVCSYMAYLHYWRDNDDPFSGITRTAVQEFAIERKLMGAQRAAALINGGRLLGLLAVDSYAADPRVKRYRTTAATNVAFRRFLANYAECTRLLLDSDFYGHYLTSKPDAPLAIVAHAFKHYHIKIGPLMRLVEPLRSFAEKPDAYKMIVKAYADKDHEGVVSARFEPLSMLLGVSRTKVRRIFEGAEAAGYLSIIGRGGKQIKLHDHFCELIDTYLSLYMAISIEGALRAIEYEKR